MAPHENLVLKTEDAPGFLKRLEKTITEGAESAFKMDEDPKIGFINILKFGKEFVSGAQKLKKLLNTHNSDPDLLKAYNSITEKLDQVSKKMEGNFGKAEDLVQYNAFENQVILPTKEMTASLRQWNEFRSDKEKSAINKKAFLDKVVFAGPPVAVLSRIREQLPGITRRHARDSKEYREIEGIIGAIIFQMITVNSEYLLGRWPEDDYQERNEEAHLELMATITDIVKLLGIALEYPKLEVDKITEIIKGVASTTNDVNQASDLIYTKLKEVYEQDHYLAVVFKGKTCQTSNTDDGSTVIYVKDDTTYVVHRFNALLPKSDRRILSGRSVCNETLQKQLKPEEHIDFSKVPQAVSTQTKHFALYHEVDDVHEEQKVGYKIDDAAVGNLFKKDKTADRSEKPLKAILMATFS